MINKGRSFLTLLGIIIGIAAVITITALAEGLRAQVRKQIDELGTNLVFVFPQMSAKQARTTEGRAGYVTPRLFSEREIRAIEAALRVPTLLSATIQREATVSRGRESVFVTVEGADENLLEIYNIDIAQGRYFTPGELSGARRVAILGWQTAKDLFGNQNPIGETVQINRSTFEVVGVFKERGGGLGENPDKFVYVPLKVAQHHLFGFGDKVLFLTIQTENIEDIELVKEDIKRALNRVRQITDPDDEDYGVLSQTDALKQFGQFVNVLTVVLGGVAAVSLLVGGIGIMNIMLVSVTTNAGDRLKKSCRRKTSGHIVPISC